MQGEEAKALNILLVVCPYYPETESILKVAGKIKSCLGAKVTVLCVRSDISAKYYSPFSIQLKKLSGEDERLLFEEITRVLGEKDVAKISRQGELVSQVLDELESSSYDMLVFKDMDKKLTKKLAEYSHVPTLIFRRGELNSFLICSDGSENSLRTAKFAGEIAKHLGAKVTVLSVAKSEGDRAAAEAAIEKAKAVLAEIPVDAEAKLRIGGVRDAILQEGKSHDVIALSPRGLSKLERMVFGHVSLHVLEKAESSILLVR